MENYSVELTREHIEEIISIIRTSVKAIEKGSKLRKHMLNMVSMNNIMRAFIYNYELDEEYIGAQEKLLKVIVTVEGRKDRKFFLNDIEILKEVVEKYDTLLYSATDEQVSEIAEFVKNNEGECKYIVKHGKELKSTRK